MIARDNCGEAIAANDLFGTLTITAIYVAMAKIPVLSNPILAVTKKDERVGANTVVTAERIRNPV